MEFYYLTFVQKIFIEVKNKVVMKNFKKEKNILEKIIYENLKIKKIF